MTSPEQDRSNSVSLVWTERRWRRYIWTIVAIMGALELFLVGMVIWQQVVIAGDTQANSQRITANQQISDHRWCATLSLLTSPPEQPPADPAANPSREESYKLYLDFSALKTEFGCDAGSR